MISFQTLFSAFRMTMHLYCNLTPFSVLRSANLICIVRLPVSVTDSESSGKGPYTAYQPDDAFLHLLCVVSQYSPHVFF